MTITASAVPVPSSSTPGPNPKRASRAALPSEGTADGAAFEALMGDTAALGFIKGPDGRYVYANAFLVEHLRAPEGGEWLGQTDAELWPDVAARIRADDLTVMRTKSMHIRSQGDLKTKLHAFDLGVDDILTVPFSPDELLARSIVITRRASATNRFLVPTIRLGEVEIDIVKNEVRVGEAVVHLSAMEQSVLYLLASRAGQVVTRDEILDAIWGTEFVAESNVVDRLVRSLRTRCTTTTGIRGSSRPSPGRAIGSSRPLPTGGGARRRAIRCRRAPEARR